MKVFNHHIYEYKKGLRSLILHTMDSKYHEDAVEKLNRMGISYIVRYVSTGKINIFFGNPSCIRVLELIGDKSLSEFTVEEDFVLGTMLGYGLVQQCDRFIRNMSVTLREVKKIS